MVSLCTADSTAPKFSSWAARPYPTAVQKYCSHNDVIAINNTSTFSNTNSTSQASGQQAAAAAAAESSGSTGDGGGGGHERQRAGLQGEQRVDPQRGRQRARRRAAIERSKPGRQPAGLGCLWLRRKPRPTGVVRLVRPELPRVPRRVRRPQLCSLGQGKDTEAGQRSGKGHAGAHKGAVRGGAAGAMQHRVGTQQQKQPRQARALGLRSHVCWG